MSRLEACLAGCHRLRTKAGIFARWRKQFIKTQYSLIRKLEVFTSLDKLQKAFEENQRINCFNQIKHYGRRGRHTLLNIIRCFAASKQRTLAAAFDQLKRNQEQNFLADEL